MNTTLFESLYILVLAGFLGFEVIRKVPPLLHTPLMSTTNAISGISLVGSLVAAGSGQSIVSTVLGYLVYYTLVSRGAVSRLSIQLYLIPIVSVVGGILLLGETVTIYTVLGGAIMLSAIALVTRFRS